MKKYICDRCQKECDGVYGIRLDNTTGYTKIEPNTYLDLCTSCYLGLEQYLEGWEITEGKNNGKN